MTRPRHRWLKEWNNCALGGTVYYSYSTQLIPPPVHLSSLHSLTASLYHSLAIYIEHTTRPPSFLVSEGRILSLSHSTVAAQLLSCLANLPARPSTRPRTSQHPRNLSCIFQCKSRRRTRNRPVTRPSRRTRRGLCSVKRIIISHHETKSISNLQHLKTTAIDTNFTFLLHLHFGTLPALVARFLTRSAPTCPSPLV